MPENHVFYWTGTHRTETENLYSTKLCYTPWKFQDQNLRPTINHKNLTSFLFNSWNFQILFFQYSWKLHVHNLYACISSRINPFVTFSEFWQLKGWVWVNLLKKEKLWQKSCKFNLFKAFWQPSFNIVLFLKKTLHWVVVFDYLPKLKWCLRQAFQGSQLLGKICKIRRKVGKFSKSRKTLKREISRHSGKIQRKVLNFVKLVETMLYSS